MTAWRLTLKRGREQRVVVVQADPVPKVGEVVAVKGEAENWTVDKVENSEVLAVIERRS
jgi:hypothetical protein